MVVGRLWWGSVLPLEHAAGPKPVGACCADEREQVPSPLVA